MSLDKLDQRDAVPARAARGGGVSALYAGNSRAVVNRGLIATKSTNWIVVLS